MSDFGNQMLLVKNTCPTLTSLSLFDAARAASSPPCERCGTVLEVGPEDSSFMLRVINRLSLALS